MSKSREQIDDKLAEWIGQQRIFFVATAPLGGDGHVNCSPKGGDSFRAIDPHTVAYQDLTGSGAETIAHLRENGRIVIMFCAFEGPPAIVRLHGRGEVLTPGHPDFAALIAQFPKNFGTRAVIRVKVSRVSDSCGYAVPFFDHRGRRDSLDKWAQEKGTAKLEEYRRAKNAKSIDGLPSLGQD
ncbi:MAG: pyridoxamine 5'-phosphate oxidase family protein [Nitrospirae bacterium]|nr:pyridoxamine 5'-phosphate oxidase family protein [Nitrospirota bacterium]